MKDNVYDYIKTEEDAYKLPIQVAENYEWSMYDHILTTVLYKNSVFKTGKNDNKPFKNITRPILNLQYRAEGFNVEDIVIYVDEQERYYKSLLLKKYHERWAKDNDIDTFIDELVEAWIDFGGALIKDTGEARPEVVPWQRVAFCDQTDVLSGAICEKHAYSVSQLKEMQKKGWENVDELIEQSNNEKSTPGVEERTNQTPNNYIEIYELHGTFPEGWLREGYAEDGDEYVGQVHICGFYKDDKGEKQGITLYKAKEYELPYKVGLRDQIYGRALGLGGAEELFESQVWVNYDKIHVKNMLDAASKIIFKTTDPAYANRNKIQSMKNLEITVLQEGSDIQQLDTRPLNLTVFENSAKDWEDHARQMGAATEAILGEQPPSGTPFKSVELQAAEAHGLHEYRKEKLARFVYEIYTDWVIPRLAKEVVSGTKFLAELDAEELIQIADNVALQQANKVTVEQILEGQTFSQQEFDATAQRAREEFVRGGNKRFMEILKDEMRKVPLDVEISVAGKQKNLAALTDKLVNILRFMLSTYNPQTGTFAVFDDPRMTKLFRQIMEASGLSPLDFVTQPQAQQMLPGGQGKAPSAEGTKPLQELSKEKSVVPQIA